MRLKAFLYDAEGEDHAVPLTQELVGALNDKQLLWIDVLDVQRGDLQPLALMFSWHPDSLYSILQTGRRPRLDHYGNYFQANVDAIHEENGKYRIAALHCIIGKNYILTVHQEDIGLLESFDNRIRDDSFLGHLAAAEFFASLLDWHLTDYFRTVDQLEIEVDRMDERALRLHSDDALLSEMVGMRRRISRVRRSLTPHREVFSALTRPEILMVAGEQSLPHFRVLNDRLERAIDAVENARELLIGSFDLYMTQTTRRTNEVVKTLTLFSVVMLPAGVVASLMGMNFQVSLFNTGWQGFLGVLAFIGTLALCTLLTARWKRWI